MGHAYLGSQDASVVDLLTRLEFEFEILHSETSHHVAKEEGDAVAE